MNRLYTLLIVSTALALPAAAADNACWNRDLERMDFYTNPPSRGDNTFFSFTVSGTANVTMIYPGTQSMRGLPISLYELRTAVTHPFDSCGGGILCAIPKGSGYGCTNSYLNGLSYFITDTITPPAAQTVCVGPYNYNLQYPEPELTYSGGGGLADSFELGAGSSTCGSPSYNNTKTNNQNSSNTGGLAWLYAQWPSNDSGTSPTFTGTNSGSIDAACGTAVGATSGTDYTDCELCVRTKGYWLNYNKSNTDVTPSAMVAKGNWLNFFPPKWAILRLAYKRLVNGPLLNPLREGIGTQNGSAGWFRLQKMLPQSCSGAGRPNQRIASVDPVTYNNTTNPLAEMLFNVAWTVSSMGSTPPSTWGFFTSAATHPASEPGASSDANKKAGFCPGCNAGFSVLFSDGRGHDGLWNCDSASQPLGYPLGAATLPAYCNGTDNHLACSGSTATGNVGLGLGAENDGNDFLDPNISGGAGPVITSVGSPFYDPQGAGATTGICPNDWLQGVAGWMFATNLGSNSNLAANQQPGTNLRLYTVGIGDNFFGELNTLKSAAQVGHGLFVSASNFQDLEKNITNVFLDIISNSTSFSVAAITTVQTRGTTFAFIPRFRPLGGAQWEGRLYRFALFNEFAAGCSPADFPDGGDFGTAGATTLNPNKNFSCNDIYLQDADGGFVGEDDGGTFILLDTSQPFSADGGWPAKSPKVQANPFWEAAAVLTAREQAAISSGGTARQIFTIPLDAGYPGPDAGLITFNDFSTAGVAVMSNYMKLGGVNSDFCIGLSSVTRNAYSTKEDCGRDLMKFIEGQDVMRQNTDGGAVRPLILGDIFHSSPILVTPPAPTFLCETGIINQCVRTLYAQDVTGQFTLNSQAAYNTYFTNTSQRQELLLVGANDGMLHAFQAGSIQTDGGFDNGTGQEVWAFIPPDMLPKLQRYALSQSHNILVDGNPWVRDIWKDGSGLTNNTVDHQKEADEFHTIVVVGEREGGRHYNALDITDTGNPPRFLWTFPPPGSEIDLSQGETWNDTTPNPPSIGPILMANYPDTSGTISLNATFGSTNVTSAHNNEVWVVAIAGGYDPNLVRGRAVYIVDAWSGTLLFKYSRYDAANTGQPCPGNSCDPRSNLGPVAAPVSLIDTNFDNFFDLAVFGDTQGNVHVIDMINPGTTAGTPALVNNWFGGLAFQQFSGLDIANRSPFFTMAGARVFDDNKGGPRVYLGGGDRDQIKVRDTDAADGGTCETDNLRGCIRNGCSVNVNQNIYSIGSGGSAETFGATWAYTSGGTKLSTNTFSLGTSTSAGACTDPAQVDLQTQVTCSGTSMVDPVDGGSTILNELYCDFDGGNDAGEECPVTSGKELGVGVAFTSPTITNSRFYSVKLFDAPNYSNRPRLTSSTTQGTYNNNTLADSNLTDATDGGSMAADAGGWRVTHTNDANEKTASAALLLGGCVAWNTIVPSIVNLGTAADGGQVCAGGTIPTDTAFLYQANDDTGVVQCGLPGSSTQQATLRYVARQVTVTPQQPTPVVSLNAKTGQAGYSGVSLEPGGKIPLQVSVGAASVQGDVSWLDVSRNLHNCRHLTPLPDGGSLCQ